MSFYARGTFTGRYQAEGSSANADCVIGHEFGYRKDGFGNVNIQLAEFIAARYVNLPLFLNKNVAGALENITPKVKPAEIFSGQPQNALGRGEGTWGELLQARYIMNERELNRPILVAQAYHVGRAALQAAALEMEPIIPEGLPLDFDVESEQFWTRGRLRWCASQLIAVPLLHLMDQI